MKKSVVLSIIVVMVLSFVAVGFFGVNVHIYDQTIYVDSIVPTYLVDMSDDSKQAISKVTTNATALAESSSSSAESAASAPSGYDYWVVTKPYVAGVRYEMLCVVLPKEATNRKLNFFLPSLNSVAHIDQTAGDEGDVLAFDSAGMIVVSIVSMDGSLTACKLLIYAP